MQCKILEISLTKILGIKPEDFIKKRNKYKNTKALLVYYARIDYFDPTKKGFNKWLAWGQKELSLKEYSMRIFHDVGELLDTLINTNEKLYHEIMAQPMCKIYNLVNLNKSQLIDFLSKHDLNSITVKEIKNIVKHNYSIKISKSKKKIKRIKNLRVLRVLRGKN